MRLRLQRVKMRNDAIDVKVNKGLLAFWTEEECAAGGVVHEEVFGEDGGAGGVAGGLVEAGGEGVGEGVAFGGVAGPTGGVDVEGDEEDVGGALGCADGVGEAYAFFEGDVFGFRDEGVGLWGESQISNDFPKIVDKIPDDRGWNRGKPGVNSVTLQRGLARV